MHNSTIRKHQIKYVLIGIFIFDFSSVDFIANYNIAFYPFGFVTTCLFVVSFAYSIVKYRLLDVSIVITRTGIFVAVYSIVLGIPFAVAFGLERELIKIFAHDWWIVPLGASTVLATAGPFIYLYFQRRAENQLLKEQRQYQLTLRQASMGMGQIKDLKRLLQLIVYIVTRAVSIEHCKVFLLHEESDQYILKASRGKKSDTSSISVFERDMALIRYLKQFKEPVVYEEIKQRNVDFIDGTWDEIIKDVEILNGALIVPSFMDQKLIAVLIMGKKKTGRMYTPDDIAVFSILANHAGLAIENAQFYEKMKETHKQLIKAEKMATVGTMADGLSHQINNRLHAMGFIAGDALDTIKIRSKQPMPPEMRSLLEEISHSLQRIEDNVKRGGEIVEGLLKYTRKGSEGFEAIDLNKLLDSALEMAQFKIKVNQMSVERNFNGNIPAVKANFTQLQEVFFNIIDNAYDAMMQRKTELKEEGYQPQLVFEANTLDNRLEIVIRDNGIGVKKENMGKLFTPFFTTKLSSKKGTGLGLYVIRQIIEENHGGKVEFTSEYKQGSVTRVWLPIAL